jgi:hypothetical protein
MKNSKLKMGGLAARRGNHRRFHAVGFSSPHFSFFTFHFAL